MKFIKMMSLAALAATALMAFAASASATVLYSGASKVNSGTKIESTGTNAVLKAGFATITCGHSEVDGKTETTGSSSTTVEGKINKLTFTECNATVNVIKNGSLIIHHNAGTDDGTVTSVGAEVTVATAGTSCTYGTPTATTIGTLNGGGPATLSASASLTRVAGGFLCANPASWTASYSVSTPNPLHVTAS